tara:strand:+ start:97 stop:324 length:228 start_codon:yes stop_codon:yes gene_type:complete
MSDNHAVIEGYTVEVWIQHDKSRTEFFPHLVKPGTKLTGGIVAWDMDEQDFVSLDLRDRLVLRTVTRTGQGFGGK